MIIEGLNAWFSLFWALGRVPFAAVRTLSFGAISGFFVEGNASVCNVALFIFGGRCYRLSA